METKGSGTVAEKISFGSSSFGDKGPGQNYFREARWKESRELEKKQKKDERRHERTSTWNRVDRKMPRFRAHSEVSDRVRFALLTRPLHPPVSKHPLALPRPTNQRDGTKPDDRTFPPCYFRPTVI